MKTTKTPFPEKLKPIHYLVDKYRYSCNGAIGNVLERGRKVGIFTTNPKNVTCENCLRNLKKSFMRCKK